MRIDLVTSGVEPVDSILGGVANKQTTLVRGEARTGKTCFALTYLVNALRRGEPCCLITTDAPESILEFTVKYLEHDLKPHLMEGRLTVLTFGPGFDNKVRSLGGVDEPFGELRSLAEERGIVNLVIDTFDSVLAATEAAHLKSYIRGVIGALSRLDMTCVCTVAGDEGVLGLGVEELASWASCTVELVQQGDQRRLTFKEVTWCRPDEAVMAIELVHGKGIVSTGVLERRAAPQPAPAAAKKPSEDRWRADGDVRTVMMLDAPSLPAAPEAPEEQRSKTVPASGDDLAEEQMPPRPAVVRATSEMSPTEPATQAVERELAQKVAASEKVKQLMGTGQQTPAQEAQPDKPPVDGAGTVMGFEGMAARLRAQIEKERAEEKDEGEGSK